MRNDLLELRRDRALQWLRGRHDFQFIYHVLDSPLVHCMILYVPTGVLYPVIYTSGCSFMTPSSPTGSVYADTDSDDFGEIQSVASSAPLPGLINVIQGSTPSQGTSGSVTALRMIDGVIINDFHDDSTIISDGTFETSQSLGSISSLDMASSENDESIVVHPRKISVPVGDEPSRISVNRTDEDPDGDGQFQRFRGTYGVVRSKLCVGCFSSYHNYKLTSSGKPAFCHSKTLCSAQSSLFSFDSLRSFEEVGVVGVGDLSSSTVDSTDLKGHFQVSSRFSSNVEVDFPSSVEIPPKKSVSRFLFSNSEKSVDEPPPLLSPSDSGSEGDNSDGPPDLASLSDSDDEFEFHYEKTVPSDVNSISSESSTASFSSLLLLPMC